MPIKGRHTYFYKKPLIRNGKLDVDRLKNLLYMNRKCKERQETFAKGVLTQVACGQVSGLKNDKRGKKRACRNILHF